MTEKLDEPFSLIHFVLYIYVRIYIYVYMNVYVMALNADVVCVRESRLMKGLRNLYPTVRMRSSAHAF